MHFFELNKWFWSLPEIFHVGAFAVIIALYTHLMYGFYLNRKRIPPHVQKYFLIRTIVYLLYVFGKVEDERFGMFDTFLPIYFLAYIDGLIILNGFAFYRCKNLSQAIHKIFKFKKL